jgi:hypothetical protein
LKGVLFKERTTMRRPCITGFEQKQNKIQQAVWPINRQPNI